MPWEPGDPVWIKYSTYPLWPGRIAKHTEVAPKVAKGGRKGTILVHFFGTGDFGWVNEAKLEPFIATEAMDRAATIVVKEKKSQVMHRDGLVEAIEWCNTDKDKRVFRIYAPKSIKDSNI